MIRWNFRHVDSEGNTVADKTNDISLEDAKELFMGAVAAFKEGLSVFLEECSEEKVALFTRPALNAEYELYLTFSPAGDSTDFRRFLMFARVHGKVLPRPLGR